MKTPQPPNKHGNESGRDNLQARLSNLFAGQEPPSYASVYEVEEMKARINELQAELASKTKMDGDALTPVLKTNAESFPSKNRARKAQVQTAKTSWLPAFLTAPVFASDEEKTRAAKLLHQIVMASWFLPILAIVVSVINPSVGPFALPAGGVLVITLALIMLLNRAGKIRTGSYLIVGIVLIVLTYLNYSGAGEPRPLLLLTVIAIMISGLLLGGRSPLVVAVLLATQHAFILSLYARGLIVPQSDPAAPLQNAIVTGISYLLIGFILRLAIQRIQFVVNQLREDEVEMELKNRELQVVSKSLEQRVADRTHDLELASDVGRAISERVGNLSNLLSEAVELIGTRFSLYYTQIYLVDSSGRALVLRAGTGEVGAQLLQRAHRLPVTSTSLNGHAASTRQPVMVSDTQASASFLANPLLPRTRSELAVPLIASDIVLGVLDLQSHQPSTFNESNLPAFQALAAQLAIAIQNAALFTQAEEARHEVEQRSRQMTNLAWQSFLDSVQRSETLGYIFNQGEITTATDRYDNHATGSQLKVPLHIGGEVLGEFRLADSQRADWSAGDEQLVTATAEIVAQHIDHLRLLAQADQYRREAEQVSRRLTREGWQDFTLANSQSGLGFAYDRNNVIALDPLTAGRPAPGADSTDLMVREEVIGQIAVQHADSNSPEASEIIRAVAGQLADHIENLRLSAQNERRAYELATVAAVSTTASTVLNPDELLQSVVDLTKERFGLYHAHIYLADKSWNTLLLAAGAGDVGRELVARGHAIPLDTLHSLVARAARGAKAVVANDVRNEADFLPNALLPNTRSEMAVPMIVGDVVLGVLDVQSDQVGRFTEEDQNIQTTLAAQVAVALQNARLYQEQTATVAQLRELDRLKSSFLANMSHELRTPLNSILGFSDVILEGLDGPLNVNMDNDVRLIQKNGQHLLHLINDVLDMAKIEAGRMNLNPEKFMVLDILEEVTSITSALANEKSLTPSIDKDLDPRLELTADRTRLRQVMINLVNNSIKFTDSGEIRIGARREGENVLIAISDTGVGIPPDKLESIFQEFTQVDTSTTRKAGGTGLGLPISRRLVEMHGGRLWAESSGVDGEGAVFFVELPIESRIAENVSEKLTN